MNWLDIVLVLMIVGTAVLGAVRGFGRTVFDALGLYLALGIAAALAPMLAAHVSFHAGSVGVNQSWAFALLFLVFGALMIGVSRYVYGLTHLDTGMFEKLLGVAAGIAVGMIVAHGLVWTLVTGDSSRQASATLVAQGVVGSEMYSFTAYHSVMDGIMGVKSYHRQLVDVGGK